MKLNLKLKICGMLIPENIHEVASVMPDYMGFIFYRDSPRYVTEEFIMPQLPSTIKKVGVFVNESVSSVLEKCEKHTIKFIQLHGNESVDECAFFKSQGLKVIKAFFVHDEFDFSSVKPFESMVDYVLFDTKGKYAGGNNLTFNWKLLSKYNQCVPFFLSGGLSLERIQDLHVLSGMNIHALDFNSGVEVSPGLKSVSKIREVKNFIKNNSQLLSTNS
jgi:phosphoribosylanthranilate isomerase